MAQHKHTSHDAGIERLSEHDTSSDCAIIITVHNHIERFGIPCLLSVLEHSGNARVYLYDNESSDPKIDDLKELAGSRPNVDFIRIDDQDAFGGLTGTWNDGIRRARKQGMGKVILLNHDVVVDNTWVNFIQAIESDYCVYGPLTNRPGGGGPQPQKSDNPTFKGLQKTKRLLGFCMGFTLGKPELKLVDDWRFINPKNPFGGNEFEIQKRMKKRSAKAECFIVTDCWVFHCLNRGWKDDPRYQDPHRTTSGSSVLPRHVPGPRRPNYITEFCHGNNSHCLRREILPLSILDPDELKESEIFVVEDKIDRFKLQQEWRWFLLSSIFRRVNYIRADDVGDIANPTLLNTSTDYEHHKFIDYTPKTEYIRLSEFIKDNAGIEAPEEDYVLLNQRPEGNRYLMESNSGLPLEEYLRRALSKRNVPFKSCDFSTMRPAEQVQICLGAKVFIAAHGAAFSNVVFTPRHCLMLEYNFRKYWNCDPVCKKHFHGRLADHEECDGELTQQPHFHKAEFHNLCRLFGRPYSELEVVRYGEFFSKNPICRRYLFVDGADLLAEIEAGVALSY